MNAGSVRNVAQNLLRKLFDIAGNLNIRDISETEGIILRHGEDPIIKRIENENDAKVENDDVLITCYRSYAHPQEGVLVYKIALFCQQNFRSRCLRDAKCRVHGNPDP